MRESGLTGATVVGYWGIAAPAAIPRDVLDKLSGTIAAVIRRPDVRQRLIDQGFDPVGSGPADYERVLRSEIGKWGKVIRAAGIKVD